MIFLQPWHGALAAALVVPAVLLLYVLRLRRRPLRVSSSLFWPTAPSDAQVNEPFKRLHFSWMLLLHLLIVLLLCAALARPASRGAAGDGDRVVLLFDVSASMDARDEPGGPTRLERAKIRAGEIIDGLSRSGTRRAAAVLTFGAAPEILESFTASAPALRAAVDRVTQTDEAGDFSSALRMARALVASSFEEADETASVRVVLLSDGGVAADVESLAGIDLRYERIASAQGSPAPANIGITGLGSRRDSADTALVRVFCEILANTFETTQVPVSVAVSGLVAGRRLVTLSSEGDGQPARATITFEVTAPTEALITVALESADSLAGDNAASLLVSSPRTPPLLVVHRDGVTPASDASLWLLTEALAELPGAEVGIIDQTEYAQRAASGLLRADSTVIFHSVRADPLPPGPSIGFGAPPSLPGLRVADEPAALDDRTSFFWPRRHPLMRNISLDSLIVASALPADVTASSEDGVNTPRWTELLLGPTGPLMLLCEWQGVKRVVTTFDLASSNWPMLPAFAIFLADVSAAMNDDGLRGERGWHHPGAFVPVTLSQPRAAFTGPASLTAVRRGNERGTMLGPLRRAGVYLAPRDVATPHAVAVNIASASESMLESPTSLRVSGHEIEGGTSLSELREHWPRLLQIAALLLMLEWVVFARGVRV